MQSMYDTWWIYLIPVVYISQKNNDIKPFSLARVTFSSAQVNIRQIDNVALNKQREVTRTI